MLQKIGLDLSWDAHNEPGRICTDLPRPFKTWDNKVVVKVVGSLPCSFHAKTMLKRTQNYFEAAFGFFKTTHSITKEMTRELSL